MRRVRRASANRTYAGALGLALLIAAPLPGSAAVQMDPINGTWRDSFTDLSGIKTNRQGAIQYPSGYMVNPEIFTWSQPYGETGISESFSSSNALLDPTIHVESPGSEAERLTLWFRKFNPGGKMKYEKEYYTDDPSQPTGATNNGLIYPEVIRNAPFEGSTRLPVVGWGTWEMMSVDENTVPCDQVSCKLLYQVYQPSGAVDCVQRCEVCACRRHFNEFYQGMGAPMTPAIGSWYREPVIYGPSSRDLVPGFGYSATFLAAVDLGESHYEHSSIPYLNFEFRERGSKKSFVSTTAYESDFLFKDAIWATPNQAAGAISTPVEFYEMTPVTLSLNPLPALPSARWDVRVISLVEPRNLATLAGHNHCTILGPIYLTADEGNYVSPVLDTLSDMTRWESISWRMVQSTGFQDSNGKCTPFDPRDASLHNDSIASVIPCGSPLTPVQLTYRVRKTGSVWEERVVPHGGEVIPGLIGLNMVDLSATLIRDAAWNQMRGRYFGYSLRLFNRSAARKLDPDLAPANGMNGDSNMPYPDFIYNGSLRPVVEQIRVQYRVCAAQVISRTIAPPSVRKWGKLVYATELPTPGCAVGVDVTTPDGTILVNDVKSGQSLAGIDPFRYPAISLSASLFNDPADCDKRPVLLSWEVSWDPLVDLIELGCNGIRPHMGESCPMQVEVTEEGPVRVAVHDAAGQLVQMLLDDVIPAQARVLIWDGRNDKGDVVAAGVYFISANTSNGKRKVKRLAVIR